MRFTHALSTEYMVHLHFIACHFTLLLTRLLTRPAPCKLASLHEQIQTMGTHNPDFCLETIWWMKVAQMRSERRSLSLGAPTRRMAAMDILLVSRIATFSQVSKGVPTVTSSAGSPTWGSSCYLFQQAGFPKGRQAAHVQWQCHACGELTAL
jgi:hypothetical protein